MTSYPFQKRTSLFVLHILVQYFHFIHENMRSRGCTGSYNSFANDEWLWCQAVSLSDPQAAQLSLGQQQLPWTFPCSSLARLSILELLLFPKPNIQ
jgi:hypothetical protein